MPRIDTSTYGPLDFCKRCFPSEKRAKRVYSGPDDKGSIDYEVKHPDYNDGDYYCLECGESLTDFDN